MPFVSVYLMKLISLFFFFENCFYREKEIGQIEDYVKERMLNMDSDIAYGETLFYSALWDEYINKTDSKLIEDLNSQLGEAQQKLSEVIANHEENDEQKLQEVMAELTEKLKADFEKDKKVKAAQFESRLEGKDLKISELKNKNEALEKRVKELEDIGSFASQRVSPKEGRRNYSSG